MGQDGSVFRGESMKFMFAALLLLGPVVEAGHASELYQDQGYKLVNGVNHFYRISGEGETFIVLHGGPGMYHDELFPFFQDFAKTHRVIFYDQRGNGRSAMATIDSSNFTTDLMVEDLEGLRQAFGIDKLNIIGHSWGGLLAMYYTAKYPSNVKRLITVDSAPVNTRLLILSYENQISRFSEDEWKYLQGLWESEAYLAGDPDVHNEAMRLSEGSIFYNKAMIDTYMDAAAFNAKTARNAVSLNDLSRDMKLNITVQDGLSKITCPTLIIQGKHDFIVPESSQLAHQLIVNSEVVFIEDSGHYPFVENPVDFFAALNSFIERTR